MRARVPILSSMFSPSHRGGSGVPLVCLHGFTDTWRTWELVLPALERRHDVLAPTLAGHAGGPALGDDAGDAALTDAVERAMDEAGFATAHVVGNSLGGYVALQLAARGRARSVVALAPAGGWEPGAPLVAGTMGFFERTITQLRAAGPYAEAIAATPQGRRAATEYLTTHYEHIPVQTVARIIRGAAECPAAPAMLEHATRADWTLDVASIACPLRIVWGTADRLLPWPAAAARFRRELPQADWIELDGVGHCPQLDVPLEAAELILGIT